MVTCGRICVPQVSLKSEDAHFFVLIWHTHVSMSSCMYPFEVYTRARLSCFFTVCRLSLPLSLPLSLLSVSISSVYMYMFHVPVCKEGNRYVKSRQKQEQLNVYTYSLKFLAVRAFLCTFTPLSPPYHCMFLSISSTVYMFEYT